MENVEIFKAWAPDKVLWSNWAKPVAFMGIGNKTGFFRLDTLTIDYIHGVQQDTMIIVDEPGASAVEAGIALARIGYRPVPLFNGCSGPAEFEEVVKTAKIEAALKSGAFELKNLVISNNAPPVFLLDYNRMNDKGELSTYDNRWSVFPQDMPSAEFLISNGIKKVIVRSKDIQTDLRHVLRRYQDKGLKILAARLSDEEPQDINISKPLKFKSIFYSFMVFIKLRRNSTGGFGGIIPDIYSHGGGG